MAAIQDVIQVLSPRLAALPDYDGQEPPDSYYNKLRNINEMARPLGVAAFNAAERTNIMKGKMSGRYHPVPAQNPYNANANIVTEAEFLRWLEGKYRTEMIGTQRAALKALLNEKFHQHDSVDTYEKRIRPLTQGIAFADLSQYLYEHLPGNIEMRIRIANPANLNAFFEELRNKWLESGGNIFKESQIFQQPQTQTYQQPQIQTYQQPQIQTYQQPQPRYIIPGAENAYVDDTKGGNYNFEDMKNLANEIVTYMRKSAPIHSVDESRNKLLDIAESLGYPDNYPKDANSLRNWIDIELSRRLPKDDIYNFNLKKVLEVLKDQPIKTSKTSRRVSRKCSKCGKSGHTKSSCPKAKKKRKKKTNYVEEVSSSENSSSSESESESESSDSSSSDENRVCYGLKKKVLL